MTSHTAQLAIVNLREAGLGDVLHLPESPAYDDRTSSYWSLTAQLRPWAIVQPQTTEEVSKAVTALVNTPDCKFAVRRLVSDQSCCPLHRCLFIAGRMKHGGCEAEYELTRILAIAAAIWPGPAPITSMMA